MSFQLSEQLDADATAAFAFYKKYIENFKHKFPASVLAVLDNPNWYGGCDSKAPHDGELKSVAIEGFGTESSYIELLISKPWINLNIRLRYKDVFDFDLPRPDILAEAVEWRYEQFRHYDPYDTHGVENKKMFTHDIEWACGAVWHITASDIEVEWINV
ncbi:MAG: hypothetical protein FWC42_03140 [Proteobacteria bacterium]|nr:hypothetical protein [Pseudomonadota bacterium]